MLGVTVHGLASGLGASPSDNVPPGMFQTSPVRTVWALSQFKGKEPPSQRIYDKWFTAAEMATLIARWREKSLAEFRAPAAKLGSTAGGVGVINTAGRNCPVPSGLPGGKPGTTANPGTFDLKETASIDQWVCVNPNWALSYNGITVSPTPTSAERRDRGGLKRYLDRGGWLIYLPLLKGGGAGIAKTRIAACMKTSTGKAYGCNPADYDVLDGEDWTLFSTRHSDGSTTFTLRKVKDWESYLRDYTIDALFKLALGLKKALDKLCPVVQATPPPSQDPKTQAVYAGMQTACKLMQTGQSPTTPTLPDTPTSTPAPTPGEQPWYRNPTGQIALVIGGGLTVGLLAVLATSNR